MPAKKPDKPDRCELLVVAAVDRIANLLMGIWNSIGQTNKILRATELRNKERHEELMKALGAGQPPIVRTMVYTKKRREKIPTKG